MEWLVKNAVNRDVERQHLNKILQEIKSTIDGALKEIAKIGAAAGQQDIQGIVGTMVTGNTERGVGVTYNPQKKTLDFIAKDFTITLQGDVTGTGEVTGLGSVIIDTAMAVSPVAPNDGEFYWQHGGGWEPVLPSVRDLQYIEGSGLIVRVESEENNGYEVRAIEGTADQIDVVDGDGIAGNPTLSLADLIDAGGGTFKLVVRDTKGRILGSSDGTTDDVPEGTSNLYFTDLRAIEAATPPYYLDGTYFVPEFKQTLFQFPIDIEDGSELVLEGMLIEC